MEGRSRLKTLETQEAKFETLIQDRVRNESYHAYVKVRKKVPRDFTYKLGRFAIAEAFIQPVYQFPKGWNESYATHHHFIIEDLNGNGRLLIRDLMGTTQEERPYSIWDLGDSFGLKVTEVLRKFA